MSNATALVGGATSVGAHCAKAPRHRRPVPHQPQPHLGLTVALPGLPVRRRSASWGGTRLDAGHLHQESLRQNHTSIDNSRTHLTAKRRSAGTSHRPLARASCCRKMQLLQPRQPVARMDEVLGSLPAARRAYQEKTGECGLVPKHQHRELRSVVCVGLWGSLH